MTVADGADFRVVVDGNAYPNLLLGYGSGPVELPVDGGTGVRRYVSIGATALLANGDPPTFYDAEARPADSPAHGVLEIVTPYLLDPLDHLLGSVASAGIADFDNEEEFGGWGVFLDEVAVAPPTGGGPVRIVVSLGYAGDWTLTRVAFNADLLIERRGMSGGFGL